MRHDHFTRNFSKRVESVNYANDNFQVSVAVPSETRMFGLALLWVQIIATAVFVWLFV